MSDRQKKRYVLTALNGMDIEAVGTRNMKAVAELFENCKLQVRYIDIRKRSEAKLVPKIDTKVSKSTG